MSEKLQIQMEAEAIKALALQALEDLKALNIIVLDVRDRASFTDYMVFASGNSNRHVNSIAASLVEAAKHAKVPPIGVEGETVGEWVLVDLGDVIVHVMLPATRDFYELEKLWSEERSDESEF